MRNGIVIYALLLAGLIAGTGVYGAEPKVLEFERDILPIFTANCIGCHGENDPGRTYRWGNWKECYREAEMAK